MKLMQFLRNCSSYDVWCIMKYKGKICIPQPNIQINVSICWHLFSNSRPIQKLKMERRKNLEYFRRLKIIKLPGPPPPRFWGVGLVCGGGFVC
jgi:hypothetical protein